MHYLIDGHNLIARIPGLSLADPDDEAKLVGLLRRWTAADSRRKVVVIFDAGLPAGLDKRLSGGGVKVIFAPNNATADRLLVRRMDEVRDTAAYMVISSDAAILAAAERRRIPAQRSEQFAAAMIADRTFGREEKGSAERPEPPALDANELQEWLKLFGPEPKTTGRSGLRPRKRPPQDR
jgi:predicted RNA-binding protein with PIN domain